MLRSRAGSRQIEEVEVQTVAPCLAAPAGAAGRAALQCTGL
jgi:hypothetical protein